MKIYNIFGRPEEPIGTERDQEVQEAIGLGVLPEFRIPAPSPLSATDRLQRNLERTVTESMTRAEVLRLEIAAREAELADVLRAEEAARIALGNLTETGHAPYAEDPVGWPFPAVDQGPITEDDLSAACGLALEVEMGTPFEEAPVKILEELLSTEQIPQERFDEEMKRREAANG